MTASAYLDTVLVSGLVKRDIASVELDALIEILSRFARAELSLVCSDAVEDELAAIPSDYRGPHMEQLKVFRSIPRVEPGGITRLTVMGVSGANPYRTLWDKLRALLPDPADAEHIFVASSNRVKVLITVDERTMLNRRSEVHALCSVELMRPTEFLHAVSSGSQQAVGADRDPSSRARRMCVISLCTRGALDSSSRGRSTAALGR